MTTEAQPSTDQSTFEISLWHILAFLARSRRVIVITMAAVAVLTIIWTFLQPRVFASTFSFRPPSGTSSDGQLASLAAQFGVNIGRGQTGESPAFFSALLKSRSILERLASRNYPGDENASVSLATAVELELPDTNPLIIRDKSVLWLTEAVQLSVNTETGIVLVTVRASTARLAHALAQAHVEELHKFNQEFRRVQASSERTFIEQQTAEAQEALREAEERLRRFLGANRTFESSPDLRFEHDRLQREVMLRQTLYASLAQALQQARIAEVRDTPLITIIDAPLLPALPVSRRLLLRVVIALMLGGILGIGIALMRRTPERDDFDRYAAYDEVRSELGAMIGSLRRLLRLPATRDSSS